MIVYLFVEHIDLTDKIAILQVLAIIAVLLKPQSI